MAFSTVFAITLYFAFLLAIAFFSRRKRATAHDFILGGRGLNYYVTAMAAHASDMSAWLFMAYPAVIITGGVFNAWTAIGLVVCMYVNWHFVAPRIRKATERYNSLTLSGYFESHFHDKKGVIRLLSGLMAFFFFTIYISAGLVGLGLLFGDLFGISYVWGITIGIVIAIAYPFIGGYVTLAWTDFFQGLFLLFMICIVPIHLLVKTEPSHAAFELLEMKNVLKGLFPDLTLSTLTGIFFIATGWGLGYFGQPHIITKFMGIRKVEEMNKSKRVGIGWMIIVLFAATVIGLMGSAYLEVGRDPNMTFIDMVNSLYSPFFAAFILCAILAAAISVMGSQVLVLTSHITEDFYKTLINPRATSDEMIRVARLGILASASVAYIIAYREISSIYNLVFYAWTGLGCSFGPLVLLSLFVKSITRAGAIVGICFGGAVAALWPLFNKSFFPTFEVPAMIPGFMLNLIVIYGVSRLGGITLSSSSRRVRR